MPPLVAFLSLQDNLPCRKASWEKGAAGFSKPCYWSRWQGRPGPGPGAAQPPWHLKAFLKSQVLAPCGLHRSHPSQPVGDGSAPALWLVLSVPWFPNLGGAAFLSWEIFGDAEPKHSHSRTEQKSLSQGIRAKTCNDSSLLPSPKLRQSGALGHPKPAVIPALTAFSLQFKGCCLALASTPLPGGLPRVEGREMGKGCSGCWWAVLFHRSVSFLATPPL